MYIKIYTESIFRFQLYYIIHRFRVLPFADELGSHTTLNNFHHLISIGYINRNTENTEKIKVKKMNFNKNIIILLIITSCVQKFLVLFLRFALKYW